MKVLIRLPNWLGDVVMSAGALDLLGRLHPDATVHGVVKDGLQEVAGLLPGIARLHIYRPATDRGVRGSLRYAAQRLRPEAYDLYLSLPSSFSAAWLGFLAGIPRRRGFRGQLRSALLSEPLARPRGVHRVEEYAALIPGGGPGGDLRAVLSRPPGCLPPEFAGRAGHWRVLLNVQSEALSRRLPLELGARIGRELLVGADLELVLTGTVGEQARAAALTEHLGGGSRIRNWTGRTGLGVLAALVADADLVISTDSGLAHLANALGTPGIVFFGAGDPASTAPYRAELRTLVRDPGLPCVPCVSNRCRLAAVPPCLESIDPEAVAAAAMGWLAGDGAAVPERP